ncbi:MAG: hypothetical protein A4E28_01133 [Methanocella sp. PtaU1.Bin125]|nr:MAG: hypothetical protein A4E28_01133 [Methanocella sp. PtaU1.Bin125]
MTSVAEKRTTQARLGPVDADFFTVGYERLSVEELFSLLKVAGVHCLADVRDTPWSRVHDYRKGVLEGRLEGLGAAQGYHVRYVSIPSLGNPAENRKSDRSHAEAMTFYRHYVQSKTKELDELHDTMARCRTALMCYEADPAECHRSELARIMAERYGLTYADLR